MTLPPAAGTDPMPAFSPTPEGARIIAHNQGHAIIRAGAGTGKTTAMVEWVCARIAEGVDPRAMLFVCFNRSAKEDAQSKLEGRLGTRIPWVRTFNALGLHLYRRLVEQGELPTRKLRTSSRTHIPIMRAALKEAWRAQHGDQSAPAKHHLEAFMSYITLVKAHVVSPADVFERYHYAGDLRCFISAFATFQQEIDRRGEMTFEDQIWLPAKLLVDRPELIRRLMQTMAWVVVDEYQDINEASQVLIDAIAQEGANVIVVGDIDQTIYSFRGSRIDYISEGFERQYAPVTRYQLTNSFRFGPSLARAATLVINHEDATPSKLLVSHPSVTEDTGIALLPHAERSVSPLIARVSKAHQQHKLHEHAVLTRYFAATFVHEIDLHQNGIPYHVYGRGQMLLLPPVAALMAVLCLVARRFPEDEEVRRALWRGLVMAPTLFLKSGECEDLVERMQNLHASGGRVTTPMRALTTQKDRFQPYQVDRFLQRASAIEFLLDTPMRDKTPSQVLTVYMGLTDFQRELERTASTPEEAREQLAYVEAIQTVARNHANLDDLVDDLSEILFEHEEDPPAHDHLQIRTIHAVKGAEYPHVTIIGAADGAFPRRDTSEMDEERRLFYVAITRARKTLAIIHPECPQLREEQEEGLGTVVPGMPAASRFIFESEIHVAPPPPGKLWVTRKPKALAAYLKAAGQPPQAIVHPAQAGQVNELAGCLKAGHDAQASECHGPRPITHPLQAGAIVHSNIRGTFKVLDAQPGMYLLEPLSGRRFIQNSLEGDEWAELDARRFVTT